MPWAEVWTRPGDAAYGRRIKELPVSIAGATVGFSGVGSGSMTLPKNYSRLNEILYTDPDVSSNGVWSTIRFFDENGWLADWLPSPRLPAQSKEDPGTQVSGDGIESIIGFGSVEPWDWDGSLSFVSTFPDWIYGGRNLLSNPGFEDSVCRPEVNTVTLDPTVSGGTFTLQFGANTTAGIAWNASAFDVETAIEQTPTPVADDVNVTGSGTEDDPWVITAVDPCVLAGGLIFDGTSLTPAPGTSVLDRVQFGALQPNPWTKSQVVSSGTPRIFGEYDSFRVTTAQAHTGTYSLLIDPAPIGRRFAGAQQILNVQAGGIYQASVWVRTASASQEYRLVIRGIDEDFIASTQVTPSVNTWTQLTLTDLDVGDNTQIIFRISNINVTGNPAIFYVDDGNFSPGQVPSTVGLMFGDLYAAWIDPLLRTPIVWDDGSATDTPYLTLDFSDTLDSDGAAWAASHSLTFRPRMTGLDVLGQFEKLGYEWRVVPDSIPLGTYLLQIYNPDGLGGVVPAQIIGGQADIRRNARYFSPSGSTLTVQGQGQITARDSDAGLLSAFGRIESSLLDQGITSSADALAAASDGVTQFNHGVEGLVYTLRYFEGMQEPLILYRPGDTIGINDPGVFTGDRRVAKIELAWDQTGTEFTVYLGSSTLVGQANTNNMVNILWSKFKKADEPIPSAAVQVFGGGGMMTVAVAAFDASSMSQQKADIVCSGSADDVQIMEAMEICWAAGGGTVWLSEGHFEVNTDQVIVGYSITYPEPTTLRGMGYGTKVRFAFGFTNFVVYVASNCKLLDMDINVSGIG